MYKFSLSRKSITPINDNNIIGYNYYIIGSKDGEVLRNELIHTSINSNNPLDLKQNDAIAKGYYDKMVFANNHS